MSLSRVFVFSFFFTTLGGWVQAEPFNSPLTAEEAAEEFSVPGPLPLEEQLENPAIDQAGNNDDGASFSASVVELKEAEELLRAGSAKDARRRVERYLSGHKKSPEGWTMLSFIEHSQGRYAVAVKRAKRALKFNPQFAPAYFWLGKSYEGLKKWDDAANEYQAALLADKDFYAAREAFRQLPERARS